MSKMITMPKLGFDMAEGKLVRWVKQVGDTISDDSVLVEVETDKATVEVQAFASGVLRGIFIPEDTITPVGQPIAVIGTADEAIDVEGLKAQALAQLRGEEAPAAPAPAPAPAATPLPAPVATPAPVVTAPPPVSTPVGDGMGRVSPVAQRMALEHGLDIRQIVGSGPQGRVIRRDVEAFLASGAKPAAPSMPAVAPANPPAPSAPAPAPTAPAVTAPLSAGDTAVPTSKLRQAIARRLTESKQTVPHFYVTSDVAMEAAMAFRTQLNTALAGQGVKLSVNDLIVKAVALALRKFPNLNASFQGTQIVRHANINIGIAVSVEGGLLTIVVRNADTKGLGQISKETKEMATRARDGKVNPNDIDGATFTTSNLGMYDVDEFIAIINPPDAAILAIGSVRNTPVVNEAGEIVAGQRMRITISADHRASDGAEAAQFLQEVKALLQNPWALAA
ncbi:MAG TPA: dihydrolipoamide acetyltransferase family protein [Anaerolineales bacterium]|nr:dihydrolipoamide acetyltransferase family protein [Anaerolineales bacterium]